MVHISVLSQIPIYSPVDGGPGRSRRDSVGAGLGRRIWQEHKPIMLLEECSCFSTVAGIRTIGGIESATTFRLGGWSQNQKPCLAFLNGGPDKRAGQIATSPSSAAINGRPGTRTRAVEMWRWNTCNDDWTPSPGPGFNGIKSVGKECPYLTVDIPVPRMARRSSDSESVGLRVRTK
jgi:hypothetical protein